MAKCSGGLIVISFSVFKEESVTGRLEKRLQDSGWKNGRAKQQRDRWKILYLEPRGEGGNYVLKI